MRVAHRGLLVGFVFRGGARVDFFFFFFNDTATTEIYTLSLHDALPISYQQHRGRGRWERHASRPHRRGPNQDRKSTRLNSSHGYISYAVFCLKKKKKTKHITTNQLTGRGNVRGKQWLCLGSQTR